MPLFVVVSNQNSNLVTNPNSLTKDDLASSVYVADTPDDAYRQYIESMGFRHRTGSPEYESQRIWIEVYEFVSRLSLSRVGTPAELYEASVPDKSPA